MPKGVRQAGSFLFGLRDMARDTRRFSPDRPALNGMLDRRPVHS